MKEFKKIPEPISTKEIILWWEKRRLNFSLMFFTLSFAMYLIIGEIFGNEMERDMPMWVIIELGIIANIFYTFNWILEIFLKQINKPFSHRFRIYLYRSINFVTATMIIGLGIIIILIEKW